MNHISLSVLKNAAKLTKENLGLRHMPVIIRDMATAFSIASSCVKPQRVMLGQGAYWVVCPADAARLEAAGIEYAG